MSITCMERVAVVSPFCHNSNTVRLADSNGHFFTHLSPSMDTKNAAAQFNQCALDLLEDLCGALPDNDDLQTARLLASTLMTTNPNNSLAISGFLQHAVPNKRIIENRDLDGMVEVIGGLLPDRSVFDDAWGTLSRENQEVVADYVEQLWKIAAPHSENDGEAAPKQDALLVLFNAGWRDLVGEVGMTDVAEKLDRLVEKKGNDHGVLWAIMEPLMAVVAIDDISAQNITSVLMPPQDASGAIEVDILCIGEDAEFPLASKGTMKMAQFLREKVSGNSKACMAYHYLKIMVGVKTSCPPEVVEMMGHLLSGSDLF